MSGRTKPMRRRMAYTQAYKLNAANLLLGMHQVTPANEITRIMVAVDSAYQRILAGGAAINDLEKVGTACNLAQVRCTAIGNSAPVVARLDLALAALKDAEERYRRTGSIALTGPGIQHVADGIAEYETILRASTVREMHEAYDKLGEIIAEMEREQRQTATA